ncbi:DUF6397 family protein [Streptomyces yaizuensis]|uniref:DUF6397 family protein n=1 Tax=Streptomyces yaizuensis TaxID=2989713 RepID=A0ABQ5NT33_9ACTN|nr:DUF6397 family protein [Streptomyces sp. YSPA8]GLF93308.1 DUF6397 family protein [Streptomyces sp. YSPA8]
MTHQETLTPTGAARLLDLRRAETDLAIRMGLIRTAPRTPGGPLRVTREETDRLRAMAGFPEALRERVRTVGTRDGAALLGIGPARFTRLARLGHIAPITFYTNRYHAVVWRYLADDLRTFAATRPQALTGRTPAHQRTLLESGEDHRARTWRAQRTALLLSSARDPWERAAVLACALGPDLLTLLVPDPVEYSCLRFLAPPPDGIGSRSATARDTAERLARADHPDETRWFRAGLADELRQARATGPAPLPGRHVTTQAPPPAPADPPGTGQHPHPLTEWGPHPEDVPDEGPGTTAPHATAPPEISGPRHPEPGTTRPPTRSPRPTWPPIRATTPRAQRDRPRHRPGRSLLERLRLRRPRPAGDPTGAGR